MTITNQHVGWGIIILICLSPWIPALLGSPIIYPEDVEIGFFTWLSQGIRLLEMILIPIAAFLFLCVWIGCLIQDDIEFEWHINLPKRKKKALPSHSDFLKLGTLDQDSKEWREIYNRLDDKGQWG